MSKESPLVSIIINNYNYGRFIRDAIDSALNQTYSNIEVIVVDDGSKDNSIEIIKEYGSKIIPVLKENGGQASAFNAGYNSSKGEIICFLDSDDTIHPIAIEKFIKNFDEHTVRVSWPLLKMDEQRHLNGEIVPKDFLPDGDLLQDLIKYGPSYFLGVQYSLLPSGHAWARRFLRQVLPVPEEIFQTGGGDIYLLMLSIVYGKLKMVQEPLGCYRIHGSNDTLKPFEDYMSTFTRWFEYCCHSLSHHLNKTGINVHAETWPRNSYFHQKIEKLQAAKHDIDATISLSEKFILVDASHWVGTGLFDEYKPIDFLGRKGEYMGFPIDSDAAILQIEVLRSNGASSLLFLWTSFWWLEYYSGMNDYLRRNYRCTINNEKIKVFDLKR